VSINSGEVQSCAICEEGSVEPLLARAQRMMGDGVETRRLAETGVEKNALKQVGRYHDEVLMATDLLGQS
jgi:hypothetical protein